MKFRKSNQIISFLSLIAFCIILNTNCFSQNEIENVIVETFYISDGMDATDTIGGGLIIGSTTYRIFVDLAPGVKLRKIYGDLNHPLIFESTEIFFNNKEDGQTFAERFNRSRFDENTVALDSWLALGKVTTATFGGVLKENDSNGSIIAGIGVNDGGSEEIINGLLNNINIDAGIPISEADGLDTLSIQPTSFASYGIVDLITGNDSTMFGSIVANNKFESRDAGYFNSGAMGIDTTVNHVLVAQLTTKGTLTFKINLELERTTIAGSEVVKYVASDSILMSNEFLSPFLSYPQTCGCQDPNYIEFSEAFACSNPDSCRNLIVFGCTDPLACNYDQSANFNIQGLCCYIGNCNDLDISLVCPDLSFEEVDFSSKILLYPNPATTLVCIKGFKKNEKYLQFDLINSLGQLVQSNNYPINNEEINFDTSKLNPGVYYLNMKGTGHSKTELLIIIKN